MRDEERPYKALKTRLLFAQTERSLRPYMAKIGTTPRTGWNIFEMLEMHQEVNRLRVAATKPPDVTWDDISRVEQMASGHVDYTTKFALYCEDLVLR